MKMENLSAHELNAIEMAREGNLERLFDLAVKYATEEPTDIEKSIEMFEICGECGSVTAHKNLALLYIQQKNMEKAYENQRIFALYDHEGLGKYVQIL